ncbi:hypothetical protein SDC9_164182 [bioreactor metagenome]|uniref:Uncharacterized protein n=1 Tax=bioreactor metagenome TaxID=1076179 RepID=A0A645FQX7_9ZZZZ
MSLFKISRTRDEAARIWRRSEASSLLAESAISSSPTMEPEIRSSRCRLVRRDSNRWSITVLAPSRTPYSRTERAHRSTAAISSSSRVFSTPPMSARCRAAATGFRAEKAGVPRRTIMSAAAVVWPSSRRTWCGSSLGRRARARSRPSPVTACSASSSSTLGSSRVRQDFSIKSVISALQSSVPAYRATAPAGFPPPPSRRSPRR